MTEVVSIYLVHHCIVHIMYFVVIMLFSLVISLVLSRHFSNQYFTQSLQPLTLNFLKKHLAHRKIDNFVYMRPQHLYYIICGP